jgi:hypothetical protein
VKRQIPEWALCCRTGCCRPAKWGYLAQYGAMLMCDRHLKEEKLPDSVKVEKMSNKWWKGDCGN